MLGNNSNSSWDIYLTSLLGREMLERVSRLLPEIFGYYALILGNVDKREWFSTSRITHQFCASDQDTFPTHADVRLDFNALSLSSDTFDLVLMPHTFESADAPETLLDEIDRILIPEGQVVITGFNPLSLWSIWKKLLGKKSFPWVKQVVSSCKIQNLLRKKGFSIERTDCFYYRPPVKSRKWLKRLRFLELIGAYGWPGGGAVYLIQAKKQVSTLTPIKIAWKESRAEFKKDYVVNCSEHN